MEKVMRQVVSIMIMVIIQAVTYGCQNNKTGQSGICGTSIPTAKIDSTYRVKLEFYFIPESLYDGIISTKDSTYYMKKFDEKRGPLLKLSSNDIDSINSLIRHFYILKKDSIFTTKTIDTYYTTHNDYLRIDIESENIHLRDSLHIGSIIGDKIITFNPYFLRIYNHLAHIFERYYSEYILSEDPEEREWASNYVGGFQFHPKE